MSDFTHAACSHVSFKEAVNPGASISRLIDAPMPMEYGLQYSSPNLGHGAGWMTWPDDPMLFEAVPVQRPEIVEWLRGIDESQSQPGGNGTPERFAKSANVGVQRARKAFIRLEHDGLLVGYGPRARRVYGLR